MVIRIGITFNYLEVSASPPIHIKWHLKCIKGKSKPGNKCKNERVSMCVYEKEYV